MTITPETYESEVLQSELPVLLDVWADGCAPCKQLAAVLDELSKEETDKIKICKLNVSESLEVVQNLGVRSVPTVIIFDKGIEQYRYVGALTKTQVKSLIDHMARE